MALKPPTLPKNHPEFDITGWATVYDKKCTDGRTILPNAFSHMEYGGWVPLMYMHNHDDAEALIGKAYLYPVKEGVYAGVCFNNTQKGRHMKECVSHGDICSFSIYAGDVIETQDHTLVHKATIQELSVVITPANPEARMVFHPEFSHYDESTNVIMFDKMTYYSGEIADDVAIIHADIKPKKNDEDDDDEYDDDDVFFYDDDDDEYDDAEEDADEDEEDDVDDKKISHSASKKKKTSKDEDSSDEDEEEDDSDEDDDDESDEDEEPDFEGVFDTFNEKQLAAMAYLLGNLQKDYNDAIAEHEKKTEESKSKPIKHSGMSDTLNTYTRGENMANLFEQRGRAVGFSMADAKEAEKRIFSTFMSHVDGANNPEKSLRHAYQVSKENEEFKKIGVEGITFIQHADGDDEPATVQTAPRYGIGGIEALYPYATEINNPPMFIQRDIGWAQKFWSLATHKPFSRVRSTYADLTQDEARARGYIKDNEKIAEYFPLLRRETSPTTVYKLQSLAHDDFKDIVSFNVINMLKTEMRMMLDEEISRAALIGDGRSSDEYGTSVINPEYIRPIATDAPLYTIQTAVAADSGDPDSLYENLVDASILAQVDYRGTGLPILFAPPLTVCKMLVSRDKMGNRRYKSDTELAQAMNVRSIERCECMQGMTLGGNEVLGVAVNPVDYVFGADRGGEVELFEDFDIKFNKHYMLIETRVSGALNKPKSAIVFIKDAVQQTADRSTGGVTYFGTNS